MITTGKLSGKLKPIHQRNALLLKWWSESKLMLAPDELNTLLIWWQRQGFHEECLGRFLVRHGVLDSIVLEALDMFSGGAAPPAPKQLFAAQGLVTLRQLLHQYRMTASAPEDALRAASDDILSPTEPIPPSGMPTVDAKGEQTPRNPPQPAQRFVAPQEKTLPPLSPRVPALPTPILEGVHITPSCPTPMTVRLAPVVGQRLGKCQLVERIGEGTYGIVFRAKHMTLDTDVAVKVLNLNRVSDNVGRQRRYFQLEAKVLARIQHPNLVRILDFEDDEQYPYLVLEFVTGPSMAQMLQQRGRLPIQHTTQLIRQTTEALRAAHKVNVVHRDVKPANIMVTSEGCAKLTDLGMAAFLDNESNPKSREDCVCGTPNYLAPEQFQKPHVDYRSDIYSLGCTFFHAITGHVPFAGETPFEVMIRHAQDEIPLAHIVEPSVPPAISKLILRMMAKYPEQRFQNYADLLLALDAVSRTLNPPTATPTPSRRSLLGWLGWGKQT